LRDGSIIAKSARLGFARMGVLCGFAGRGAFVVSASDAL
jgi:hypothetical protein